MNAELAAKLARRQKLNDIGEPKALPAPTGAGDELAALLKKRASLAEPETVLPTRAMEVKRASANAGVVAAPAFAVPKRSEAIFDPSVEFSEFTVKEAQEFMHYFRTYDVDRSGTLNVEELKKMMESGASLGTPQTHTALTEMVRGVGGNHDGETHTALTEMVREVDGNHDGEVSMREFFSIMQRARNGSLKSSCQGLQDMAAGMQSIEVHEVGVGGAKSFFEAKANQLKRSQEAEDKVKSDLAARKSQAQAELQRKADFKARLSQFNNGAGGDAPAAGVAR
ncbi:hypothetical protein JKP88DRAFT_335712 [Tribonema minus]|uniref:EF-hand domain-containing protein n=1 Tax=Tribonema minus TaxID=303371 RepID=A0A835YJB2_9STRA|nr:hypothetical protein JKP88DRAFT_335712 [Tribonema minus]